MGSPLCVSESLKKIFNCSRTPYLATTRHKHRHVRSCTCAALTPRNRKTSKGSQLAPILASVSSSNHFQFTPSSLSFPFSGLFVLTELAIGFWERTQNNISLVGDRQVVIAPIALLPFLNATLTPMPAARFNSLESSETMQGAGRGLAKAK